MNKFFSVLFSFSLITLFFLFKVDSIYAACSPGCNQCIENVGEDTVKIVATQPKCSSTEPISYEVDVLFINSMDVLIDSQVIRHSATINHNDKTGTTNYTWNNSSDLIWPCTNPITDCQYNTTQRAGISSEIYNPANYLDGIINFEASVDIEIIYSDLCLHKIFTISGDSCTVTLPGTPTPTPVGDCTPNNTCGANNQCLPTQICNSSRKCEVLDSCGCTGTEECGGSNCPSDSVCVSNRCIQTYDCILCTDTSGVCGAKGDCDPWDRCTNGVCKPDSACVVGSGPKFFCTSLNGIPTDKVTPYIYTALGCVPYGSGPFVSTLLTWSMGVGGGIAFLVIVWGSVLIITGGHDPKKIQAGQEMITAAISGIIMIIISVLLINYLGDKVLNLGPIGFRQ